MWIGVEIGGTKLQVAVANGAGEIREIWRATVDTGRGGEGIRHCLRRYHFWRPGSRGTLGP